MTKNAIIKLAIKALYSYAQEHYGFRAKFHPEEEEKWKALMEAIKLLEGLKEAS